MQKTAENALFLRSDLTVQDRILEIRSLASLGRASTCLRASPKGEAKARKGQQPRNLSEVSKRGWREGVGN